MRSMATATRTRLSRRWLTLATSTCVFGLGFPVLLAQSVENLLPPNTALAMFVNDFQAYAKSSKSLPMAKIMAEPEVQKFLEKPMAAVSEAIATLQARMRQEEGLQDITLDADKLFSGDYGRIFLAVTHFEMAATKGSIPDIGLIIGIERRQGAPDWLALMKDAITRLAASEGATDVRFEKTEESGAEFEILRGANEEDRPAICAADVDGLQLFSISKKALLGVLHRLKDHGPALATQENWSTVRKELGESRPDSFQFYVDLPACLGIVDSLMGVIAREEPSFAEKMPAIQRILDKSGMRQMGSTLMVEQATNGVAETKSFTVLNGEPTGLMRAFMPSTQGIDLGHLKSIPENTASFTIFQMDLATIHDFVLDAVREISPEMHEQAVTMLDSLGAEAGNGGEPIRLREDLWANLGPTFLMITPKKFSMMQTIPPMLFATQVRNGERVLTAFDQILTFAGQAAGQNVKIETEDRKNYVLHLVNLGAQLSMVRPAYTVSNGYLYLSTDPGLLKQHLKRLEKGDVVDITSNPDYQRFASHLPAKGVSSITYADTRYSFETMYDMVISMLPIATSMIDMELPIDLQLAPMRETISQHLFGSFSYTECVPGGARSMTYSSMGAEVMVAAVLGAASAGAYMAVRAENGSVVPSGSEDGLSISKSRSDEAPADVALRDMNSLSSHVLIYRLETSTTPAGIDDLKKPIKNYPNGVWSGELPKDPWGNSYLFTADGKDYRLWSMGPNGVDDQGTGDDLVRESSSK